MGPSTRVVLELSVKEFLVPLAIVILVTYVIGVWMFYYVLKGEEEQFWPRRVLGRFKQPSTGQPLLTSRSRSVMGGFSPGGGRRAATMYRATCSCDWQGEIRAIEKEARFDALDHLRTHPETSPDRPHRVEIQLNPTTVTRSEE